MKAKKLPAKRRTFWCIYKKGLILGEWCRTPISAWPKREDAEDALKKIAEQIAKDYVLKESDWERLKRYMADYMIEEMPVIMKAWQVPN